MKTLLVPICVDTDDELCDIDPFVIRDAILNKLTQYVNDPDRIYDEVEEMGTTVPVAGQSKGGSFMPMPGDKVHLLQFGSKKKKKSRKKASVEKPKTDFERMKQWEIVFHILENDWTSVKDIGRISSTECKREIPEASIRRILSKNRALIEQRKQSPVYEYRMIRK